MAGEGRGGSRTHPPLLTHRHAASSSAEGAGGERKLETDQSFVSVFFQVSVRRIVMYCNPAGRVSRTRTRSRSRSLSTGDTHLLLRRSSVPLSTRRQNQMVVGGGSLPAASGAGYIRHAERDAVESDTPTSR